jgi:hypothetical protein
MERSVTPADCALGVALPLRFEEFARDAESPDKDFVRAIVAGSGRSVAGAWRELYEPKVVELYARIAARAEAVGVTICAGVTAASLHELLDQHHVVSLLAHSRLAAVGPHDVVLPAAIRDAIDAGTGLVTAHLRDEVAGQPWATDEATVRVQVAAALDAALEPSRVWLASTARTDAAHRPVRFLHRVMLEDAFDGALRRAPLLELRDGLLTMDELVAAIPVGFDGVLDLSVCNSVAFGESIKRRRPDCLVVENVFLARADLRLVRYGLVVSQLGRQPARYTEALTEVTRAVLEARA